ncbi:hypothetical protein BC826DRAFT_972029 [Russula brevipes]|nr:hypothetical protein BC826DRAFT_972029 [Russula brevipes]
MPASLRRQIQRYVHPDFGRRKAKDVKRRISALLIDVVLTGFTIKQLMKSLVVWSHIPPRWNLTASETVQLNDRRLSADAIETREPLEDSDASSEGGIREIKNSMADSDEGDSGTIED